MKRAIKKIPSTEITWVRYHGKCEYVITSNALRDKYTLYRFEDKQPVAILQSTSPAKLYEKVDELEK